MFGPDDPTGPKQRADVKCLTGVTGCQSIGRTSFKVKPRPPVRSAYFLSRLLRFSFSYKGRQNNKKHD